MNNTSDLNRLNFEILKPVNKLNRCYLPSTSNSPNNKNHKITTHQILLFFLISEMYSTSKTHGSNGKLIFFSKEFCCQKKQNQWDNKNPQVEDDTITKKKTKRSLEGKQILHHRLHPSCCAYREKKKWFYVVFSDEMNEEKRWEIVYNSLNIF